MSNRLLSALAALLLATPAMAGTPGGFYANLDYNQVQFSNAFNSTGIGGTAAYPNPSGLSIGVGYGINNTWAAEFNYAMIGDSSVKSVAGGVSIVDKLQTSLFTLTVLGTVPVNEQFSAYVRAGLASVGVNYTQTVNGVVNPLLTDNGSTFGLTYGIGAQYSINKAFTVRAQFQNLGKVSMQNIANCRTDCSIGVTSTSLGATYSF